MPRFEVCLPVTFALDADSRESALDRVLQFMRRLDLHPAPAGLTYGHNEDASIRQVEPPEEEDEDPEACDECGRQHPGMADDPPTGCDGETPDDIDDGPRFCPDCGRPNQFGERCMPRCEVAD